MVKHIKLEKTKINLGHAELLQGQSEPLIWTFNNIFGIADLTTNMQ